VPPCTGLWVLAGVVAPVCQGLLAGGIPLPTHGGAPRPPQTQPGGNPFTHFGAAPAPGPAANVAPPNMDVVTAALSLVNKWLEWYAAVPPDIRGEALRIGLCCIVLASFGGSQTPFAAVASNPQLLSNLTAALWSGVDAFYNVAAQNVGGGSAGLTPVAPQHGGIGGPFAQRQARLSFPRCSNIRSI
jgi:hypothetical protein